MQKINKKELIKLTSEENVKKFELYVSPFINLLNSITNSTRPKKVGQLSEIFNDFIDDWNKKNMKHIPHVKDWSIYYNSLKNVLKDFDECYPKTGEEVRKEAAINIYNLFLKFKDELFPKITLELIQDWVDDLIIQKTYNGMMLEQPVASYSAKLILKNNYPKIRFDNSKIIKSGPKEESIGIDWKYIDKNNDIEILLQVKTGNSNAGKNLRSRRKNLTNIPDNVYFCVLDSSKKDEYIIDITLNGKNII